MDFALYNCGLIFFRRNSVKMIMFSGSVQDYGKIRE